MLAQLLVPNNDPVSEPLNEPVLICVELDTVPAGKFVEFNAYDAVVAYDALVIVPFSDPVNDPLNDPVLICVEDDTVPIGRFDLICAELLIVPAGTDAAFNAYDAVVVYDDDTTLLAQLLVPCNEPVIPLVTFNDPLNTAGPIFVNVDEPETVNEPVTLTLSLMDIPLPELFNTGVWTA